MTLTSLGTFGEKLQVIEYNMTHWSKGPVIIYLGGGGRGGVKAILDWLEGGLIFFRQLIRGLSFVRFCKGLVCAFANGISFRY